MAHGYSYCHTGGIIGRNSAGTLITISKCFIEGGSVKSTTYAALSNTFASNAGGIAGYLGNGSITNCYSTGSTIQAFNDASDESSTQISYTFNGSNSWNTAEIAHNTAFGSDTDSYQNQRLYRGDIDIGRVYSFDGWNWGYVSGWPWEWNIPAFVDSMHYTDTSKQLSYKKIKNKTYKCSGGIVGYVESGATISTCYSDSKIGHPTNKKYETTTLTYNLGFKEYDYREGLDMSDWTLGIVDYTLNIIWHNKNFSNNLIYNTKRTVGRIYGYAPSGYTLSGCYGASISADAVDFYSGGKHNANDGISYHLYKSGNSIYIKSEWGADSAVPRSAGSTQCLLYTDTSGLASPLNSYAITTRQDESLEGSEDISKIASATGSAFTTNPSINGGKPFIKDFYWEYNVGNPFES